MSNPIGEASKQLEALIQNAFAAAIAAGQLPEAPVPAFVVEIPADTSHGDFATNAAMVSARAFHSAPRKIAETICGHLTLENSFLMSVTLAARVLTSPMPLYTFSSCSFITE